jgi:lysophospholipase L1-like esterase
MSSVIGSRVTLGLSLALAGLALAGCGGSRPTASDQTGPILVAALGDGVTAGSPGWDPNHGLRRLLGFGDNPGSQWEYWAAKTYPNYSFRNCGVYGQRTDQIARRLNACATGADILVVGGGMEDIRAGRPVEVAARNIDGIVRRAKKLGLRVEVTELIPWNNRYPAADRKIRALNALIHHLAHAEHVAVLPFYKVLDDPANPGRMKDTWTAEGDYPSASGYQRLGELAFRPPQPPPATLTKPHAGSEGENWAVTGRMRRTWSPRAAAATRGRGTGCSRRSGGVYSTWGRMTGMASRACTGRSGTPPADPRSPGPGCAPSRTLRPRTP